MLSSPTLEKGSRFPSPLLGKGSLHSPVQYWEKVLSNTGKRFYVFPSPILGKGSISFLVQCCEKVLGSPSLYRDRFYRFPRPVLGKGSVGYSVLYYRKDL